MYHATSQDGYTRLYSLQIGYNQYTYIQNNYAVSVAEYVPTQGKWTTRYALAHV